MAELTLTVNDRVDLAEAHEQLLKAITELAKVTQRLELVVNGEDLSPLQTLGHMFARCPIILAELRIARTRLGDLLDRAELVAKVGAGHVPR